MICSCFLKDLDFNPRSLTGATNFNEDKIFRVVISIHAPLRERLSKWSKSNLSGTFQSTLPYGSDKIKVKEQESLLTFQSTLPYGSDIL